MDRLARIAITTAELAFMATWAGVLLVPMLIVGVIVARRGPAEARWLLAIPLVWLFALERATQITAFSATTSQVYPVFIAGYVAIAISGGIGPAIVWARRIASWPIITWLALNLVVSLSTLLVAALISFTT